MVGNKCDLANERAVSKEAAKNKAKSHGKQVLLK
jgi:hypothetical protein